MRNRIIFGILKLITTTLLTLAILTMFAYNGVINQDTIMGGYPFDPFYGYTLDMYNEHIQTRRNLPDNFISMDMLEGIGTYDFFYYNKEYGFTSYDYDLILENGYTVQLSVQDNPWSLRDYPTLTKLDITENMLYTKNTDRGRITSCGLEYYYIDGRLYSIDWRANGLWFSLSFGKDFKSYPAFSQDTIVGKLLSKSPFTQMEALRQLPDSIGNVGIPPTICIIVLRCLPISAFVLLAALLGLIFIPRHRKEHDHPKYYANDFRNL